MRHSRGGRGIGPGGRRAGRRRRRLLTDLLDDPAQAVKRAQKLANTGQFTVDQILDEATDSAVLSGLLSLHGAQRQSDPSPAAAKCLAAAGHFALAVSVVLVHVPVATP